MIQDSKYSVTAITKYFIICVCAIFILYFGRSFFIPLFFGLLIAILLFPACKWLEQKRIPRGISITILLLMVISGFLLFVSLLGYELNLLLHKLPEIQAKLTNLLTNAEKTIEKTAGISIAMANGDSGNILSNVQGFANSILSATFTTVLTLVMIPIYTALFLYQRETFVKFILSFLQEADRKMFYSILNKSIRTYFKFIKGTFLVYIIVGILNSAGLYFLGIKHALLFGMVSAFMTAIPYIGIIISAALPIAISIATKDSMWYAAGIIAVFTIVQYLEANVIFPRVVGQQLNLSTFSVLSVIILGTLLWGVAGMILFVPFAAILKIISDDVPKLKPLNIILNREEGYTYKNKQ